MMAEKARLFGDGAALDRIMAANSPQEVKQLGRTVVPFDEARWSAVRSERVVKGNLAKFEQNAALKAHLLATYPEVLVEAAPADRVWGIGIGRNHPDAVDPLRWPGLNLLGFALVCVRTTLRGEVED